MHTGDSAGIIPNTGNLYSGFSSDIISQNKTVSLIFNGSSTGTNPEFFKFVPYDTLSSGINTEISGTLTPTVDAQSLAESLDSQYYTSSNIVDITFPYPHSSPPTVTYTLGYTGNAGALGYVGAMINGTPTETGVVFVLTSAPNATGYVLFVETSV